MKTKLHCLGFIVSLVIGFAIGFVLHNLIATPVTVTVEPADDSCIMKTVAHVDLSDRDDLQLIYEDNDSDIAYYAYTGERNLVKVGETVYDTLGQGHVVTDFDINGFYFAYNNDIHTGMSGTSLVNENGEIVGYISSILNGKVVKCIWN